MIILKNLTFILLLIISSSTLLAQPVCRNDIEISIQPGKGQYFPFQPVQSVWLDDPLYGSELQFLSDDPFTYDCSDLAMISRKPTLLFGTYFSSVFGTQNHDNITLEVANYYLESKTVRAKFTILEENNRQIAISNNFVIPAATPQGICYAGGSLIMNIPAPLSDNIVNDYFEFQSPGIKHIKMELVFNNGAQILDADPVNQVILLKCEVREARKIPVVVIPLLFKDRLFKYNIPTYFSPSGSWFGTIVDKMKFVYDVLPVPEHFIGQDVIDAGFVPLFPGVENNADWIMLSEAQQKDTVAYDLFRFSRAKKFLPGKKILLMVDKDDINSNPPPNHIGYLSHWINTVGVFHEGIPGIAAIEWNCIGLGGTIAHEISHLFGIWVPGGEGEEYHVSNMGDTVPAYGYRVKTKEYKNHSTGTPFYCLMGNDRPDDKVWIHKPDYKRLIESFTLPEWPDPELISIAGKVAVTNNYTSLLPFYKFFSHEIDLDSLMSAGRYSIKVRNNSNQLLNQYGFNLGFNLSESLGQTTSAPFNFNIPSNPDIKKIEICDSTGTVLAQRNISNNSPIINVQYPSTGEIYGTDSVYIGWNSSDPDGDTLYHAIFYSVENLGSAEAIWLPIDIDVKGDHYNLRTLLIPNLTYRIKVFVTDGYNTAVDSSDGYFTIGTPSNITVIPEGFLNESSNSLNMKDSVRIYLRSNFTPYSIIDSAIILIDSLSFTSNLFFNIAQSGTYYVVIRHRNCIETWSKQGGESYSTGDVFSFDFTSAASQTYGSNSIQKGKKYCIYSGDVDQNGNIDLTDVLQTYNGANAFESGYVVTDLNGDNLTDLIDVLITYNNSAAFVAAVKP